MPSLKLLLQSMKSSMATAARALDPALLAVAGAMAARASVGAVTAMDGVTVVVMAAGTAVVMDTDAAGASDSPSG